MSSYMKFFYFQFTENRKMDTYFLININFFQYNFNWKFLMD